MIYLDSSALTKMAIEEAESAALVAWLRPQKVPMITCALARTEVVRAVRARGEEEGVRRAQRVLAQLRIVALGDDLLDEAAMLDPIRLRTLDAIHLRAAQVLGPALQTFVAYDKRLLAAAEEAGMQVASPGC